MTFNQIVEKIYHINSLTTINRAFIKAKHMLYMNQCWWCTYHGYRTDFLPDFQP